MPVTGLRQERPRAAALLQRPLVRTLANDRRIRYLVVGGIAAAVFYAIFTAGWLLLSHRIPYLLMVLIANVATAILTYPLYRTGVFQSTGPYLAGFLRFYTICFWNLVLAFIVLPLLVEVFHLHVLVSTAIMLVLVPVLNYQVAKLWAFRHR